MGQTRRRSRDQPIAVAVQQWGPVRGEVVVKKRPTGGSDLTAKFTQLPVGKHGFHIHKAGDLRGEGCKGACSHQHVGSAANHGGPPGSGRQRHEGDLGNIELPTDQKEVTQTWRLRHTRPEDLQGRSIIVHADEDDLGLGGWDDSKTTGHSGARMACAIFGRGTEKACS